MVSRTIARGMRTHLHPLDEDSAARLLQGLVHPDDAPPGYGSVARLLSSAARLPLLPVDEDEAAGTVLAMVETIRDAAPASAPQASQRRPMLAKLLAGKALAAVAVVGLTATGAAAANGSLPDRVQGVVSDAVGAVGVNIPHPNHGKSADHRQDGEHGHKGDSDAGGDEGQPGDTPKPENNGQVTSDAAHTAKDAATAAGDPVGPAVCAAVTDGKCQAGADHGQNPAGETPPKGGPGENPGRGHGGESDDPADDNGEAKKPETPAGSIATGEEKSQRDLPAGKGKPSTDD